MGLQGHDTSDARLDHPVSSGFHPVSSAGSASASASISDSGRALATFLSGALGPNSRRLPVVASASAISLSCVGPTRWARRSSTRTAAPR